MTRTKPIGAAFDSYEQMATFYGAPLPKRISSKQFNWLSATHAFNAGYDFIWKRGDDQAMLRWCLQHGHLQDTAEAMAGSCINEWMVRQHQEALVNG